MQYNLTIHSCSACSLVVAFFSWTLALALAGCDDDPASPDPGDEDEDPSVAQTEVRVDYDRENVFVTENEDVKEYRYRGETLNEVVADVEASNDEGLSEVSVQAEQVGIDTTISPTGTRFNERFTFSVDADVSEVETTVSGVGENDEEASVRETITSQTVGEEVSFYVEDVNFFDRDQPNPYGRLVLEALEFTKDGEYMTFEEEADQNGIIDVELPASSYRVLMRTEDGVVRSGIESGAGNGFANLKRMKVDESIYPDTKAWFDDIARLGVSVEKFGHTDEEGDVVVGEKSQYLFADEHGTIKDETYVTNRGQVPVEEDVRIFLELRDDSETQIETIGPVSYPSQDLHTLGSIFETVPARSLTGPEFLYHLSGFMGFSTYLMPAHVRGERELQIVHNLSSEPYNTKEPLFNFWCTFRYPRNCSNLDEQYVPEDAGSDLMPGLSQDKADDVTYGNDNFEAYADYLTHILDGRLSEDVYRGESVPLRTGQSRVEFETDPSVYPDQGGQVHEYVVRADSAYELRDVVENVSKDDVISLESGTFASALHKGGGVEGTNTTRWPRRGGDPRDNDLINHRVDHAYMFFTGSLPSFTSEENVHGLHNEYRCDRYDDPVASVRGDETYCDNLTIPDEQRLHFDNLAFTVMNGFAAPAGVQVREYEIEAYPGNIKKLDGFNPLGRPYELGLIAE